MKKQLDIEIKVEQIVRMARYIGRLDKRYINYQGRFVIDEYNISLRANANFFFGNEVDPFVGAIDCAIDMNNKTFEVSISYSYYLNRSTNRASVSLASSPMVSLDGAHDFLSKEVIKMAKSEAIQKITEVEVNKVLSGHYDALELMR